MKKFPLFLLFTFAIFWLFSCNQDSEKIQELENQVKFLVKKFEAGADTLNRESQNEKIAELDFKLTTYADFLQGLEGSLSALGHNLTFLTYFFTIFSIVLTFFQGFQYFRNERKEAKQLAREIEKENESKSKYEMFLSKQASEMGEMIRTLQTNHTNDLIRQENNVSTLLDQHQKFIRELQENQREDMKRQEEKNSGLIDSVRQNISETTALITSYKDLISLQKIAEELRERQNDSIKSLKEEQIRINSAAIRQSHRAFIEEKAGLYLDYWKGDFEVFYDEATAFIRESKLYPMKSGLNADAYLIIGLHLSMSGGQIKSAEKNYEKAIAEAKKYLEISLTLEDKELLFPDDARQYYDGIGITEWSRKLIARVYYFLGLGYYRLGGYDAARRNFEQSKAYVRSDVDAWFFYFQSQYWGMLYPDSNSWTKEMLEFEGQINTTWDELGQGVSDMIKSRLWMKMGDFIVKAGPSNRYSALKNNEIALSYYEKSYQLVNSYLEDAPNGFEHIIPMVYYRYGRTIKTMLDEGFDLNNHPLWKEVYTSTEVLCEHFDMRIQNPETQYLVKYVLADTQKTIGKVEDARINVRMAYDFLKDYCSNPLFEGYSPVSNQMLRRDDLYKELDDFNRSLTKEE